MQRGLRGVAWGRVLPAILVAIASQAAPVLAAPADGCGARAGSVIAVSGTVVEDGMAGTFRRSVELGSGRSRETIDLGIFRRGSGFDGRVGWSQDVSGGVHDLNSAFALALGRSEAWLDAHQGCPPGEGPVWASLGQKHDGAGTFDAWRLQPASGAPLELWYDRTTHRLDRAFLQRAETRLVRHFADWRMVGGAVPVAFSQRDEYVQDESETTFRVTAAAVKTAAPDDFGRPTAPHDSAISGGSVTEIAYDDDHRTRIYVPVYLNGQGPFTFELDNGGHFILDAETARKIGLTPLGAFSSTGAGNAVARVGFVRVHAIRLGNATMADQPAKVRSFSASANDRGTQPPRAGILGLELFERFTIGIDPARKVVSLRLRGTPYPKPAGAGLPLLFDEDAPLVEGAVLGHEGTLMMDTGNAGATIVEDFWAQANGLATPLGAGLSDGEVRYSRGLVTAGPASLAGETLSYYGPAERGSEYTRSVAAVLGEPLLSRFTSLYDYARNIVFLDQVPGTAPRPFDRSGLSLDKRPDGAFAIWAILPGSPAAAAGLRKGDIVSAIAGHPARLLSRADAAWLLRQAPGSPVDLLVGNVPSESRAVRLTLRDLLGP